MGIFKANDIRGIFPEELDRERIRRIGYNLPAVLKAERILVGRDARNSSDEIFDVLSQGIRDAGANVVDIGVCDTPAVYFATVYYGFSGSVMITASHNPPEYNGLKISGKSAVPVGPDTGLKEIETLITEPLVIMKKRGKVEELNIRDDYSAHVRRFLGKSSRLKVVMDCGNGAA
ncbi:MAG TPA: phosphomannomutase/phosphoglucomutase, partial [Spirochaeta sp.]|nr:phosphomannomutase/phosphoglucomutase [Spirochaeta sp.]